MQIETNLPNQPHDLIKYLPIQKQVYDLFVNPYMKLEYDYTTNPMTLILDGTKCDVKIGKNGVKLSIWLRGKVNFSGISPITVRLPYNKDITKKVMDFCETIQKFKQIEQKAETFAKSNQIDHEKIKKFLMKKLGTKYVEVNFWEREFFDGLEINFYFFPKDETPEGLLMCIEKDTLKLNPFWNASTDRRSFSQKANSGNVDTIEMAVGMKNPKTTKEMKEKIKAIEELTAKINAFDPNKCPELVKLIQIKKESDKILEELKAL